MSQLYKFDNYLFDSASAMQQKSFRKQIHKSHAAQSQSQSSHQHEQYSTASSSDSDGEYSIIKNNDQQTQQQSDPQNLIQKNRYKTELCRNFQIHGVCNYGKKCQYAHGKNELNQKPESKTNQYYKTRPCKEFFNTSVCPYGQRCKYTHDLRKQSELIKTNTFYQKKLITLTSNEQSVYNQSQIKVSNTATPHRLSFFSNNFNASTEDNTQTAAINNLTAINLQNYFSFFSSYNQYQVESQ